MPRDKKPARGLDESLAQEEMTVFVFKIKGGRGS
jgi:hypothetical protein